MSQFRTRVKNAMHRVRRRLDPAPQPKPASSRPEPQAARLFPGIGKHHDVLDVGNFLASMSSAQFAIDHFDQARPFPVKNHIYKWALELSDRDGLVLEFGVASGGTVNQLATHHNGPVHGFDVFSGLPETWRPGFPKGAFAQAELPKVKPNVELVVGLFEDTLPGFVASHPGRVKLLHVDCDIYSGTVTIFTELQDRIDDETIIVFDEYFNFPGWETCEHKAFMEFCERTGREPEYLAFVPASEQVVARAIKRRPSPAPVADLGGATDTSALPAPSSAELDTPLMHVRHASLGQLASAGYNVQVFDDGAKALSMEIGGPATLPENWQGVHPTIQPSAATLRDASLFQDGSALLPDGRYCYLDATFNIEPWRTRHNRSVMRCIDPELDDALIRPHLRRLDVEGRCFSTLSNTSHNYGHFIHDVLSRIYYEDLGLIAPGRVKIIAPSFRFPMQRALFEMVFDGYEIIEAPSGTTLDVEELVLPANMCSSTRFNAKAIAALAARLRRSLADHGGKAPRKVCVSRSDGKDTGGRDFQNVAEYEALAAKSGYEVIEVSSLGLEDQFALWTNTSHILGVHGAGMMNMIMMPEGGQYTEIAGAPRGPAYTARCAIAAGHSVTGMSGSLDKAGKAVIDLKALGTILRGVA